MKLILALLLCSRAWATPLAPFNPQNFESFTVNHSITPAAEANYRMSSTAGDATAIIVNHVFDSRATSQCVSMTAAGWAGALYNALTLTAALSGTARVDMAGGRADILIHATGMTSGIVNDGYTLQLVSTSFAFLKGNTQTQVVSATVSVADATNCLIGWWCDGSGNWSFFIDGALKMTATDTTYQVGQFGFATFINTKFNIDDISLDNLTPTPTNTPTPSAATRSPKIKNMMRLNLSWLDPATCAWAITQNQQMEQLVVQTYVARGSSDTFDIGVRTGRISMTPTATPDRNSPTVTPTPDLRSPTPTPSRTP